MAKENMPRWIKPYWTDTPTQYSSDDIYHLEPGSLDAVYMKQLAYRQPETDGFLRTDTGGYFITNTGGKFLIGPRKQGFLETNTGGHFFTNTGGSFIVNS